MLSFSKQEVIDDFTTSLNLLPTQFFSFPFGRYNENLIEILKSLSFETAFRKIIGL